MSYDGNCPFVMYHAEYGDILATLYRFRFVLLLRLLLIAAVAVPCSDSCCWVSIQNKYYNLCTMIECGSPWLGVACFWRRCCCCAAAIAAVLRLLLTEPEMFFYSGP